MCGDPLRGIFWRKVSHEIKVAIIRIIQKEGGLCVLFSAIFKPRRVGMFLFKFVHNYLGIEAMFAL